MTQDDLNTAVAEATGETVRTIADRGFVVLTRGPIEVEPDRAPLTIDWDELDRQRQITIGC